MYRSMSWLSRWRFCSSIFIVGSAVAYAANSPPTFDETLAKLDAATNMPERVQIEADQRAKMVVDGKTDGAGDLTRVILKKDADRFDATEQDFLPDDAGQFTVKRMTIRFVVTDEQQLMSQQDSARVMAVAYLDRGNAAESAMWRLQLGRAMEGYVDGDGMTGRISDILRAGWDKSIAMEKTPEGGDAYVLRAKSRYGPHAIWIDPTTYLPIRIEVRKTHGSLVNESPLPDSILGTEIVCSGYHSIIVAGRAFNDKVRVSVKKTRSDGHITEIIADAQRTKIDLQPNFDAAADFHLSFPEGTQVVFEPRTGVAYEWRGGKPQPVVDAAAAAAVAEAATQVAAFPRGTPGPVVAQGTGPGGMYYLAIVGGVVLAGVAAVMLALRLKKS
jgi:hypothetical protein